MFHSLHSSHSAFCSLTVLLRSSPLCIDTFCQTVTLTFRHPGKQGLQAGSRESALEQGGPSGSPSAAAPAEVMLHRGDPVLPRGRLDPQECFKGRHPRGRWEAIVFIQEPRQLFTLGGLVLRNDDRAASIS